jgi:hypothetical protein
MVYLAGERITAARINRLKPAVYNAVGSSNLALSTTETDITGASITLTTETAGAYYVVQATFSFDITSATTSFASGVCQLDGSSLTGNARWSGEVTTDFGEASFTWRGAVGTAGSHTFKLRGSMSSGTGIQVLAAFTTLLVTIYEEV